MADELAGFDHGEDDEGSFKVVKMTQEQYDSIVSLAYNIGLGALRTSSFLRSVNGRESNEAIRERLSRWNKITDPKTKQKVESAGLTKRRADEGAAWP